MEQDCTESGIEDKIDECHEDMRETLVEPASLLVPQVDFCEFEVFAVAAPDVSIVLDDNAVEAYKKDAYYKQTQVRVALNCVGLGEVFRGRLGCLIVHPHATGPKEKSCVRNECQNKTAKFTEQTTFTKLDSFKEA